jgi:endonuclease YncB( thermonuclease family)
MPAWTRPGHAFRRSRRSRGWPAALAVLVLLVAATVLATRLDPLPPGVSGRAVASDGDSLRIGADRIRLTGLDAPELDQTCWRADGAEWPCGRDARALMTQLLGRGDVACAPSGTDRFGRTLASCRADGTDIAAAIVEAGLAVSRDDYGAEQSRARSAGRGMWSGRFTDPRQWRDEGPSDDPGPGIFERVWSWLRELTGARSLR